MTLCEPLHQIAFATFHGGFSFVGVAFATCCLLLPPQKQSQSGFVLSRRIIESKSSANIYKQLHANTSKVFPIIHGRSFSSSFDGTVVG
jgi:hypothetical protein